MKRTVILIVGACLLGFAHFVDGDEPAGQQADELRLLRAENNLLKSTNETLRAEVAKLKAENARLQALLERGGVGPETTPVDSRPKSDGVREEPTTMPATRPAIGVSVVDISAELLDKMRSDGIERPSRKGALVARVSPGSPAPKAGLQTLDIIVSVNMTQVTDAATFQAACLSTLEVGKQCSLQILRIAPLPGGKGHRWEARRLVAVPVPWADVKAAGEACPINFIGAVVRANSIGQPEAWLSVENVSTQDVVAFEVSIECFDRFDRPVSGYVKKSNKAEGISQTTVSPGQKHTGGWTLHGHDTTAKVTVTLLRVKLADGQEWVPKEGESVVISGESRK